MHKKGFVSVAAMNGLIIIAIVCTIAAIVIPMYMNYKNRDLDRQAEAHARKAYEASQAFFRANPKGQPTVKDIEEYGYQSSPDIQIIIEGGKESFSIRSTHMKSLKTYRADAKGEISRY